MAAKGASAKKSSAAASVDEQLARYRSMRDFSTTAEPAGGHGTAPAVVPPGGLPFVIQKHAATRLHYDFRLGWRGVLKSWAVAKGPSYTVADKRLAVEVEDHPMEYGGFEGTIPKGQYGGGTVMVWDQGTWEPVGDADEGLRTGRLKFILHGHKLKGHWTLIRMGGRAAQEKKPNWLLIKEHDEYERKPDEPSVTETEPNSVVTGRDLPGIAQDQDHVWDSNHGLAADERAKEATAPTRAAARSARTKPAKVSPPPNTPREPLPDFVPPQLASQVDQPPTGPEWIHELKLDGYRIQARVDHGQPSLMTRKALDWTHRMPSLVASLKQLPAKTALLDGEVVVLDEAGISSFADLQSAFQEGSRSELIYYLFDLLHLDGHSLRDLPLVTRKEKLKELLAGFDPAGNIRFSDHLDDGGEQMFSEACRLGAEGILCKEAESRYISGRSASWLKVKCSRQQEFVVGGFTLPTGGGDGLGSLLLGYYRDGKLIYAGRTGTGFTQSSQRKIRERLEPLRTKDMPFAKVEAAARRDAIWVEPKLVAEVAFRTWTRDGIVRQASFKGLREDKPPTEVGREQSQDVDALTAQAEAEISPADKSSEPSQDRETSATADQTSATRKPKKKAAKAAAAQPAKPAADQEAKPAVKKPRKPKAATADADTSRENAPVPLPAGFRLTHPDKVLDAESGLTKRTLIEYYAATANRILPQISDRPLSIVRCPNGTSAKCFFQKHVKAGLPEDVGSIEIADKRSGVPEPYITLSTPKALLEIAQMSVMELHPWGSKNGDYEHPDRLIFDLDPDAAIAWPTLAETAEKVRLVLQTIGLRSFLKSTGGKGLHIVAPIEPDYDWQMLKEFAHAFVLAMELENPKLYLTKMSKAARKDRIYLDYLRNERGATAVAPWSPRNRSGVPVSLPMAWSDLQKPAPPHLRVAEFKNWLPQLPDDPWKDLPHVRQKLTQEAVDAITEAARPALHKR